MKYILLALILMGLTAKGIMAAIKPGVDFGGDIKPTTRTIIDAAEYVFGRYGIVPTITSGVEGTHMSGSKHYSGDALDWRVWESDALGVTDDIVKEMIYYLGEDYDVLLRTNPRHIHSEYDPK